MADVRDLLRSEQLSRRITHPHLHYTRSGQLQCTVCDLLIKSASLWEGHLRSPNHRKNAQKAAESMAAVPSQAKKRKNEDSDDDSRKRRAVSEEADVAAQVIVEQTIIDRPKKKAKSVTFAEDTLVKTSQEQVVDEPLVTELQEVGTAITQPNGQIAVNEDEWAAFEREMAPLAQDPPNQGEYSATIVAAPVLAKEVPTLEEESKRPSRDVEAEEEKEEDERRLEEELEVMEEMEERVRKLKEKREALRKGSNDVQPALAPPTPITTSSAGEGSEDADDNDDDEFDDWNFR